MTDIGPMLLTKTTCCCEFKFSTEKVDSFNVSLLLYFILDGEKQECYRTSVNLTKKLTD